MVKLILFKFVPRKLIVLLVLWFSLSSRHVCYHCCHWFRSNCNVQYNPIKLTVSIIIAITCFSYKITCATWNLGLKWQVTLPFGCSVIPCMFRECKYTAQWLSVEICSLRGLSTGNTTYFISTCIDSVSVPFCIQNLCEDFVGRLCGLVIRVPGHKSRGPQFDS
jgi:hypothetical protein